LSKEASTKSPVPTSDRVNATYIAKIFVVCDQEKTAPVSGYILRQRGSIVIIYTSL
jgi:hypothetical protein